MVGWGKSNEIWKWFLFKADYTNISSSVSQAGAGRKLIKNKLKLIIASEKFQHIIDIDWISSASSQLTQPSQREAESNTWRKFQETQQVSWGFAPLVCSVDWSTAEPSSGLLCKIIHLCDSKISVKTEYANQPAGVKVSKK